MLKHVTVLLISSVVVERATAKPKLGQRCTKQTFSKQDSGCEGADVWCNVTPKHQNCQNAGSIAAGDKCGLSNNNLCSQDGKARTCDQHNYTGGRTCE